MSVARKWMPVAGVDFFNIIIGAACPADANEACAKAFAQALDECARSGLDNPQIMRSRIWARDAALRRIASDVRLSALQGDLRAASASFIAPERMAAGVDVIVDLVAMSSAAEKKYVREYEPVIAPPMFVTLGGLVFLSGNTDISATFETQIENICGNIGRSLAAAGAHWNDIVQVDAYVAQTLDSAAAFADIAARFSCAVSMTTVEGYSAPEKRVEIEVTARLAGAAGK